jgi:hypothetical protein
MNTIFEDFQDALLPNLPGALPSVVEDVFKTVARNFYRRTRVWRMELGGFVLTACTPTVPLNPLDQTAEIAFVEEAKLGTVPMQVLPPGPWSTFNTIGRPSRIWLTDPHTAVIWPAPIEPLTEVLTLTVSAIPRRDNFGLPPEATTHHYEGLTAGTLAMMLSHPKKPYSDGSLAMFNARRYETEVARAIANRLNGYVEASRGTIFNNVARR